MNSTFRMPLIIQPQPPPTQSEALLFNDILEEKICLLRNTFTEFLQVQPYQKFNAEFSNFLKRTKRIIQEGHRNGTNISRIINSTEITPFYGRPSASLYRPQTTLSVIGSSSRSAFKVPETVTQPTNNLPQNPEVNIQPTVQLSRIDNNTCSTSSFRPHATCSTVNEDVQEESQPTTFAALTISKNSTNNQSPAVSVKNTLSERNSYSDVTVIENKLEDSQKDDGSNSIESLLDNAGFKINLGKIDESNITKNKDKKNEKNKEKYLSKWSVNLKRVHSVHKPKIRLAITGSLLSDDRNTVEERFHDAGYLEGRKENNLIKTTNGIYNLIGNIIGGSPNELYHVCLEVRGIPRTWRQVVDKLTHNEKDKRKATLGATLNFSLESPAGPSNARKNDGKSNFDMNQETNVKRKHSETDLTETHKSKQRKLTKQLPPLMASTPFKTKKKDTMFETPSEIKSQKNKVNEKLHRTRNSTKEATNGTKKGLLEDQSIASLKPKSTEKTLLNSNSRTNSSKRVLGNSTNGSSVISSKQSSLVNNSKQVIKTLENDESTKSVKVVNRKTRTLVNKSKVVNKTSENDKSTESVKVVNRKSPTLAKNSKQVIKTPENDESTKSVKVVNRKSLTLVNKSKVVNKKSENGKSTKSVKNKKNNSTLSPKKRTIKNKVAKLTKQEGKNSFGRKVSAKNKREMKKKQANTSRGEIGLFDNIDCSAYGDMSDFSIMASPTKLTSTTSCTGTSRSETPPLFGNQWSSSGKSIARSEGPSFLCKSIEAKALKRVKAPKLTLEEELKNNRRTNNKQSADYKKVTNQINQMLQFGEQYDGDDESLLDSVH